MKDVVLFLCTGNSCRSQMAEGFLRAWAGNRFDVRSAGSAPKPVIHPLAIEVMREIGIELDSQSPKSVNEYFGRLSVHHVVFVCKRAETNCPYLYPGVLDRQSWPFEDPAAFVGSPQATLEKFREIRDQIGARIQKWLSEDSL